MSKIQPTNQQLMVLYLYVFIIKVPPPKVGYVINKKKRRKLININSFLIDIIT